MTAALVTPAPVRELACLDGCGTILHQHEEAPGVWRPMPICPTCAARVPVDQARPNWPVASGWALFLAGQELHCPGEYEQRYPWGVERRPCRQFLGVVAPGHVAEVQLLPLQSDPRLWAGVVQHCRGCGRRYALHERRAESLVAKVLGNKGVEP